MISAFFLSQIRSQSTINVVVEFRVFSNQEIINQASIHHQAIGLEDMIQESTAAVVAFVVPMFGDNDQNNSKQKYEVTTCHN